MDSDSILKAVLKKLGKKYEYKESLGGGGYSNVYLIRHTIFVEDHALKIMDYHYIGQKLKKENIKDYKKAFNEIKVRFINEARFYKRINHPNIVEIHDIDVIEDEKENVEIPYIIMDYIAGSSLDRILKSEAPIELRRVLRISQNVLDALEAIHNEKVIHRDIKPANIMIKEKTGEAILIDFGLAKDKLNKTTLTSSGVTMGTPPYMSPDQFRNPKNLDNTTDIYSFGVVLYEMLTGEFPFGGEKDEIIYGHLLKEPPNVRDKNPDLPVGIEEIIFKAMAKEPQQRYKSSREFWKALNQVEETQKMISKKNGKDIGTEKIEIIKPEDEKKEKKKDVELEVSKEDKREKIKKKEKKALEKSEKKEKRKSKREIIKYFIISAIWITVSAAIVAFIVFDPLGIIPGKDKGKIDYPEEIDAQFSGYIASAYEAIESGGYEKANYYLEKAREIKSNDEIRNLKETLTNKRREKMRKDFDGVELFLKGKATKSKKKEKCLTFLKRHTRVPQNDDTEFMVSETNKYIKQLEAGINADKEYQKHIASAKEYIKNKDYETAIGFLEKAKAIRDTEEIKNLFTEITDKRIGGMKADFNDLKNFLGGEASNKDKRGKCREFLNKHQNVPANIEKTSMVSETNKYIEQLEAGIKADEEYKQHIVSAKESIKDKDYETAIGSLDKAKAIRDTEEIKSLLAEITGKRIEVMKGGFGDLKIFLSGEASNKDKLGKCREFLAKHQDLPENNETKVMVAEANNFITELEADIVKDEQYQKCINAAKEYIKNVEYQKAIDELKEAKKIRETEEITVLSTGIREKQIEIMSGDFDNLKQFLGGRATKKEKKEECQDFLKKHTSTPRDNVTRSMVNEVNQFISQLNTEIRSDERYQMHIDAVNRMIKTGDYQKAENELKKAKKIKDTDEVKRLSMIIAKGIEAERKNGEKEYNAIKDNLDRSKYLAFKKKYPNSTYLPNLINMIKRADKNLPPEKYWNRPIKKNGKGYYELTFGREHNGHIMIYIPEKKIWIDKYEVSWKQYRCFLAAEGKKVSPIKKKIFKREEDEYPVFAAYAEAAQYCRRYGFRLPNENEWEYAAGKGRFTYPWGNELPDANEIYRANFVSFAVGFKGTAPVKSFEKFSSPFGAINMAGNVWEWVTDSILKGGGFTSDKKELAIKNKSKAAWGEKKGFRCIKDER